MTLDLNHELNLSCFSQVACQIVSLFFSLYEYLDDLPIRSQAPSDLVGSFLKTTSYPRSLQQLAVPSAAFTSKPYPPSPWALSFEPQYACGRCRKSPHPSVQFPFVPLPPQHSPVQLQQQLRFNMTIRRSRHHSSQTSPQGPRLGLQSQARRARKLSPTSIESSMCAA
jgi:hypothetical protein